MSQLSANPLFPVVCALAGASVLTLGVLLWARRRNAQGLAPASRGASGAAAGVGSVTVEPVVPPRTLRAAPQLEPPTRTEQPSDVAISGDLPAWVQASVQAAFTGRYTNVAPLGSGRTGTILRAWDRQLERLVAIKLLPPNLSSEEQFRARFDREAKTLAGLDHDGIAKVYDIPEVDQGEALMMVMELLDGQDLARRLAAKGPASSKEVLAWTSQLAAALQYAHDRGVIHRDVKPANLVLVGGGRVKLVDFGVVSLRDASTLTESGVRLGTPEYSPPEQLRGEAASPAADQYALGVSVFELLTGGLPFGPEVEQRWEVPPPSSRRPDLTTRVDPVIARALAPDPDDRYPSVAAFQEAFAAALGKGVVTAC